MIITIIGKGFVGKATMLLQNPNIIVWTYDIQPELCEPKNLTYQQINEQSDLIFIAVPTPMKMDGSCDTSIIDNVLSKLNHKFIIIRSTIPIGYSRKKQCYFMPEFLTEKNWPFDFYNCQCWIFGLPNLSQNDEFKIRINNLINSAHNYSKIRYNQIFFCTNEEAELIKLVRNNFLSTKVIFFNEIFQLCKKLNIDYENIQKGIKYDLRIGESHTFVDGIDYNGYGGTCFPKDTNSLFHIFQKYKINSNLLEANLYVNEYILNKNKKWLSMYDRTISKFDGKIIIYANINSSYSSILIDNLMKNPTHFIIGIINKEQNSIIQHDRYLQQYYDLQQKFFIPRCDSIILYIHKNDSYDYKIKSILHLKDFASTFEIPLEIEFEDLQNDNYLYNWVYKM